MHKIIINTMPRTASQFFFDTIREMFLHNDRDNRDPKNAGEWSQDESFIKVAHEPLLFQANFSDIWQINVLRNPIDAVSSQVFKSAYGFGSSTIVGRPEIVDGNMAFFRTKKAEFLEEAMYQESKMWEGYTYGAVNWIDRVIPFTFEQVTKQTAQVLKEIYRVMNSNDPIKNIDQEYINRMVDERIKAHMHDINLTSGAANGLPVEKPEDYQWVVEAVKEFRLMPKLIELYDHALEVFAQRQKDLGIIL